MKYKKTTLPSGLRIITIPAKGNPAVAVMVLVETGSNYELKKQNGLSHFLEHMLFKGTKERPTALDISKELDGLGAEVNAFTSNEMTGYHSKADKRQWKKILEIVSDMYLNPTLPGDDLEKERGVITEEISMNEDLPYKKVWYVLMELLYGDAPAGRPISGTTENVKKFTRQEFLDYRALHYTAEKTIVVVAGDVGEAAVVKEIKKHFKALPRGKASGKEKVRHIQTAPKLRIFEKETDQAHVLMAFHGYDAKDKRVPAMSLLTVILGGGMSSRLWQRLRLDMGACYYIHASHDEATDHGLVTIPTGISASRIVEVVKAILEECSKLATVPVTKGELDKAKEYYLGHLYMGLETTDALAGFYGEQEVIKRKLDNPRDIETSIRAVKAEDIQKLAKELFKDKNLNLAAVGNVKNVAEVRRALRF